MKKILWLSSWYPNRLEPQVGDFIERHARAAATRNDIFVLHVLKDRWPQRGVQTEMRMYPENLRAKIIYYAHKPLAVKWLDILVSNIRYFLAHRRAIRQYIRENGKPDCIHVHIALKAGLIARYYQIARGIEYVVSEQWTGICSEARPNISDRSRMFQSCWKMVMRHAKDYSAVSEYLLTEMQSRFGIRRGRLIPNVVDAALFYPAAEKNSAILFCHVSTLRYQKNPEQILQAAAILQKRGFIFSLAVIGPDDGNLRSLASSLGIADLVDFRGSMPHESVAAFLRNSTALILYSRFETFGCVIIEANASGVPVIASDIAVIRENVTDGVNGWLVPLDDPATLAAAMEKTIIQNGRFDPAALHASAKEKFSFGRIGDLFNELYGG